VAASANVSAAERHIVRRACVLIVGWSAGTQVRPAGEGTPYSPTPVVGRHHLDLDAGLAVQPRNVATQTEGSIIYALGHVLREEITIRNGRVLDSRRGATRRRRGRENSPSRPTIWGMTVFDRPTISVQFFGRFHAHGFPNKWKMPSIYRNF
jgi:hypothetical protein